MSPDLILTPFHSMELSAHVFKGELLLDQLNLVSFVAREIENKRKSGYWLQTMVARYVKLCQLWEPHYLTLLAYGVELLARRATLGPESRLPRPHDQWVLDTFLQENAAEFIKHGSDDDLHIKTRYFPWSQDCLVYAAHRVYIFSQMPKNQHTLPAAESKADKLYTLEDLWPTTQPAPLPVEPEFERLLRTLRQAEPT